MSTQTIRGVGASPGHVSGRLVLSIAEARRLGALEPVVLVLRDCRAEDARVLTDASALVTVRGGVTGHGAIIARALGKPCIVACRFLEPHPVEGTLIVRPEGAAAFTVQAGVPVQVDGAKGLVSFDEP